MPPTYPRHAPAEAARQVLPGLSIVLPCSDAEAGVAGAIRAAAAAAAQSSADYEIVVVDDSSSDATARTAAQFVDGALRVRLLLHAHPRGRGAAVRTGLVAARMPWVLLASAAEELDAADMAEFAALTRSADVVVGRRVQRTGGRAGRIGGAAWNRLMRALFDLPVHDVDSAFMLIRRELLDGIELRASGALIGAELLVRCRAQGARIAEHPVRPRPGVREERRRARAGAVLWTLVELMRLQGELRRLARTADL
jgi:glycosyltransferase involved in cell wall biosynthesis